MLHSNASARDARDFSRRGFIGSVGSLFAFLAGSSILGGNALEAAVAPAAEAALFDSVLTEAITRRAGHVLLTARRQAPAALLLEFTARHHLVTTVRQMPLDAVDRLFAHLHSRVGGGGLESLCPCPLWTYSDLMTVRLSDGQEIQIEIFMGDDGEGNLMAALHLPCPSGPAAFDGLGFSKGDSNLLERATCQKQGLILVGGPSSSGRSTTAAALVRAAMTVRDDTALSVTLAPADTSAPSRELMRKLPAVVVCSIQDRQGLETALYGAETGHLVIAEVLASAAPWIPCGVLQMAEPGDDRLQCAHRLADAALEMVCQKMIRVNGQRRVLFETLAVTPQVQEIIRQNSTSLDYELAVVSEQRGRPSLLEQEADLCSRLG